MQPMTLVISAETPIWRGSGTLESVKKSSSVIRNLTRWHSPEGKRLQLSPGSG
jgi:hypothetical protein